MGAWGGWRWGGDTEMGGRSGERNVPLWRVDIAYKSSTQPQQILFFSFLFLFPCSMQKEHARGKAWQWANSAQSTPQG